MKRLTAPKLPALPFDQADRRIIGIGLVIALLLALALVTIAGAAGLAVRTFLWTSGIGG